MHGMHAAAEAHQAEEAEEAQQAHEARGLVVADIGAAVRVPEDPVKGEHGDDVHPEHAEVGEDVAEHVAAGDHPAVRDPLPRPAVPHGNVEVDKDVDEEEQRQDELDKVEA